MTSPIIIPFPRKWKPRFRSQEAGPGSAGTHSVFSLHLALESWVLAGWVRERAGTPTLTAPTFQIAAQELSDNRVITLSLAGRKLDKKVSQSGRVSTNHSDVFSGPGCRSSPLWLQHFHFPQGTG